VIIFLSGLVFLALSVTGTREYIAKAMPDCLKKAIPAGIGLFIAFIGFQNSGIIQANPYTLVQFVDIHGGEWASVSGALVALLGLVIIAVLGKLRVKGNIILGILASTVLYYLFRGEMPELSGFSLDAIRQSFRDFSAIGVTGLFNGEAWAQAFSGVHIGGVFSAVILIITLLVDMFDTIGTLYGTARGGHACEHGDRSRKQAMTAIPLRRCRRGFGHFDVRLCGVL
jgi:AGZA family xanthine/uracil permease-like MFS transporter